MRPKSTLIPATHTVRAMARFLDDAEMLSRLNVTPAEIDALKNASLLGTIRTKEDLLLMLRVLRGETSPEPAVVDIAEPVAPQPTSSVPIKRNASVLDHPFFVDHPSERRMNAMGLTSAIRALVPQQIMMFIQGTVLAVVIFGIIFVSFDGFRTTLLNKMGMQLRGAATSSAAMTAASVDFDLTIVVLTLSIALAIFVGMVLWRGRTPSRRARTA